MLIFQKVCIKIWNLRPYLRLSWQRWVSNWCLQNTTRYCQYFNNCCASILTPRFSPTYISDTSISYTLWTSNSWFNQLRFSESVGEIATCKGRALIWNSGKPLSESHWQTGKSSNPTAWFQFFKIIRSKSFKGETSCPFQIRSNKKKKERLPDAIGIGVGKSGTGTLAFLDCHPNIVFRSTEVGILQFWTPPKKQNIIAKCISRQI